MTPRAVLVVAAHPDDEALGCGGTIAKLAGAGATVCVAFIADGISARMDSAAKDPQKLTARRAAAEKACSLLGARADFFGDFPDNRLDTVPLLSLVQCVETLIAKHRPDALLTHHGGDLNVDHRLVHQAVVTASRPHPGSQVRTLLSFEVPSSTEWQPPGSGPSFSPNWFVDISATLEKKLAALDAYAMEMRDWPHARSREAVLHLARWRGATVGVAAAEAFVLGRRIS